ncbi:unnamed protein product [Heterosigma akashiwo]
MSCQNLPASRNLSKSVNAIVYCRQLQSRVRHMLKAAGGILQDLDGYSSFSTSASGFLERVKAEEAALFQAWCDDTAAAADDGLLGLRLRGRLMEMDSAGVLVVNYDEALVRLLREVRQLGELGFRVPREAAQAAEEGEKYYRYGVMLKKVANFYNTVESQIIEQQKPMLLDSLLGFEEVVASASAASAKKGRGGGGEGGGGAVTWGNPYEVENYVEKLQGAADSLSLENRRLRKAHAALGQQVAGLMNVEMLKQRDLWKARWTTLKETVTALAKKYPKDRMKKWLLHWDHQLYKAVEAGYQMGLESLNENLGELKCELTFAQKALQFKPALEEMRQTYYKEMRKFVTIPTTFEGFGNADVYRQMASKNKKSLTRVYEKAEELFRKLGALKEQYQDWVVLGMVDLDAYVEESVEEVSDFDINFKMLKLKKKEAEKLPDFSKIDCITVHMGPLKAAVDDQLARLGDALLLFLRKNTLLAFKEVEEYLERAMEVLKRRPSSIEELGESQKECKVIEAAKDETKRRLDQCLAKKKLLLTYAPGSGVDLSEVVQRMANLEGEGGRWDEFELTLEAFGAMVEEQKEQLKAVVEEEIMALNQNVDKFAQRWKALKPADMPSWAPEAVAKVFEALEDWNTQFGEIKNQADKLVENCRAFAMDLPRFDGLDVVEEDITSTNESWGMLKAYQAELKELTDQDWISFRSNIFALSDLGTSWTEKVKERVAEGKHDLVTTHLLSEFDKIKKAGPALKYCRGDPFKEEHWSALLQGKLGMERSVRLENLTLGHFVGVLDKLADPALLQFVKHLQARAQGEVTIREALQELVAWSQTAELKLLPPEDDRSCSIIKEWKDLFLELGDKQSLLASLKDSPFFKAFADQGLAYETKLAALDKHLHVINQIQRKWVYLEPIFAKGALPSEQARFRRVDEDFRDMMQKVEQDPKLFNLADEHLFPGLEQTLSQSLDQLERCQKALADFLEEKRSMMPRFYFIGDDDLLEILGQSQNPAVIQSHLKKLFQGINKVEFNEEQTQIVAMCSSAGEVVWLESPVAVTPRVEDWLEQLAGQMKETLAAQLARCLEGEPDYEAYPSQVLCIAEYIKFTNQAEVAISNNSFRDLKDSLTKLLSQYTSYDLSTQPLMSLKIKALVLDLVHNMDVVDQLARHRVEDLDLWVWQKQLRYYLLPKTDRAVMRMSNAQFDYTYEYQGNAPKLVHTPLTDKCYLTLTQGMHMGFGGNPYGPAGTGKTESVKALGNAFGRQVLVFNCDEGIDFQSMGRIFIGLVKCGAWGCFDEFNRLKEDQLSAISQQIQIIQDAIKAKQGTIRLLERVIDVDFNAGIFVTLNPPGKNYGGRSKLPDNLKALFRPVAMGRPDNELIAEVILYSEGFAQAKDLARKIVSLFLLSKQLLSPQQHYDWGLRALKAILNTGGKLIQAAKKSGTEITLDFELEILIKAVRVNTLSKLTFTDTKRFLGLISDIFTGVESSDISGGELEAAIREVMGQKPFFLEVNELQVRKMLQLKESLDQRMGCVVVGPSGCGKSTVWQVLKAAMQKCGQKVVTYVMNPKSMPRQQLLGSMDLDTREWNDGVLTDAARKVVKEPSEVRCWVVCDGDVDPEWIESLNSVLDDNHLLTLPNGERISFGDNVNFLFETHDLRFASPATVSRMGMIFLSDEDVDVKMVVHRWLLTQPEALRQNLQVWIDDIFFKALKYILEKEQVVDTTMVGTVLNGLSQVAGSEAREEFCVGLIRGLGGNLSLQDRNLFAKEVFAWAGERPPDINSPLDCYFSKGSFVSYITEQTSFDLQEIDSAVVPTVSVQRTVDMMEPWLKNSEPFILVGPEGCGKNMMIRHAIRKHKNVAVGTPSPPTSTGGAMKSCKLSVTTLHCNAQTTAEHVITKIAQTCSLFSAPEGRVYRPRDAERLVLYLKDINLPKPDMYDTCMLIAFLQQLITFNGFYDENLEFLRLERVQLVCSMNAATTVGRHPLTTRFTAVVRIGVVDYPDKEELGTVYDTFLGAVLGAGAGAGARWERGADRERLSRSMVELYDQVKRRFSVDDHRHYLFTPRDLTAWALALLRYDLGAEDLLAVWGYEAARLFRDRLVDQDSEKKFDGILSTEMRSKWKHNLDSNEVYFTTLGKGMRTKGGEEKGGDGKVGLDPVLERVSADDFAAVMTQGKVYYEREERDLNMKLFPEILDHLARIDRVISRRGGHLLLVGSSGVGRRTAAMLVSYLHGYTFCSPQVTRNYSLNAFYSDLKAAMQLAGVEGEGVTLYVEDHHVVSEAILETVNSLLSAGEVPGLYTNEELEPLLGPLKELMMDEGTHRTPYDFFVSRVKKNLHVVLGMDSSHPKFVVRCESNPALYTCCDILWFGEWRRVSMRALPTLLEGVKELVNGEDDEEEKGESKGEGKVSDMNPEEIIEAIVNIHESCKDGEAARKSPEEEKPGVLEVRQRHESLEHRPTLNCTKYELMSVWVHVRSGLSAFLCNLRQLESGVLYSGKGVGAGLQGGSTPLVFVSFLSTWHALHETKKQVVRTEISHLGGGLGKLEAAAETVDELQTNASRQKKELKVAQVAADNAMEQITNALEGATERKKEVEELSEDLAKSEQETLARKEGIEEELASIIPVLESAKKAVGSIKNEHLVEIKSLQMPPEPIADVLSAVLKLLGTQDCSWLSMKRFLGNRGVKDQILNFDARTIDAKLRKEVSKILKSKASSFEEANIKRVSIAAAPLAAWTKAQIRYSLVLEKIQPLEAELEEAKVSLNRAKNRLEQCQAELKEIDDKVAEMKVEFAARTREAETLKAGLERAQETLEKAQHLLGQLSGEQTRWADQSAVLKKDLATLPKQMLLAAGFQTYLVKAPENVRESMVVQWCDYTGLMPTNFKKLMSTESQLLIWKSQGLPADDLSQENALVVERSGDSGRVPFIIDPANAATDWLKWFLAQDSTRPLEMVTSQDPRFTSTVELAVRFGKTLLVLDIDGVEPMLYPLARKDLMHEGARFVVQVGDKQLDFNENFRMVLVTRNPDPDLPPDAAALVTEVNFTVTKSGLEGQLLGVTIQHEQPELEKEKSRMLQQEEEYKVQLAKLEKNLLETLATAEGNLLENTALIETLTETKTAAAEIQNSLEASAKASEELDEQSNVYRPFARDGSTIFFLIQKLSVANPMYQFSLASFVQLFKLTLGEEMNASGKNLAHAVILLEQDCVQERLERLTPALEKRVLYYVGRALFKADRAMFALHLIHGVHPDQFQDKEWDYFTGTLVGGLSEGNVRDFPPWAASDRGAAFSALQEHFPNLIQNLDLGSQSKWQRWATSPECEKDFPNLRGISAFQRVMVVQTLRPDRLQSAIFQFCQEILNVPSLSPPPQTFDNLYENELSNELPLLIVTTTGADPSQEIEEFAARCVGKDRYKGLAMGGGQQEIALTLLRSAASSGDWLCLQNLHLVVAWLPTLEKARKNIF